MKFMTQARELLRDVELKEQFRSLPINFNEQLGFMEVPPEDPLENNRQLVGFATPIARQGGLNRDNFVMPITEYADLPEDARSIDQQGKGVGPRLYNVHQAFGGAKVQPPFIGLYMFDVRLDHSLDMRPFQGSNFQQIARHAGRIVKSALVGLEPVTQDIHADYDRRRTDGEQIDAVMLNVPPHPAMRQAMNHVENPAGIVPAFMIIRNPNIELTKLNVTKAPSTE